VIAHRMAQTWRFYALATILCNTRRL
jgi:hypothetical protein